MQDLRRILREVGVDGALVGRRPRLKGACCDVVLQEFLVHNVDDCGDQGSDVLGSCDQRFNVSCMV